MEAYNKMRDLMLFDGVTVFYNDLQQFYSMTSHKSKLFQPTRNRDVPDDLLPLTSQMGGVFIMCALQRQPHGH